MATVEFEHIHFFKRTLVEKEFDALASGGLTFGVLLLDGLFAAAEACFLAKLHELLDLIQLFTHYV